MSPRTFLFLLVAFAGCRGAHGGADAGAAIAKPSVAPSAPVAAPVTAPHTPWSRAESATTDPEIALGNLEAQIVGQETVLAKQPNDLGALASLAELYDARGQYLGRIADYDRAAALGERAVAAAPKDGSAWVLRARTRSVFHRFDAALEDLDQAAKLGAKPDAIDAERARIFLATGRTDEAFALRANLAKRRPFIGTLMAQAVALADTGDLDGADQLFLAAQESYRDTSPLPLATLYFQEGLMWERAGRTARARELYEAAHERLPRYAAATGHLAGVLAVTGEKAQAIALLRPLVDGSDDPEYTGQLAALLGDNDEGRALHEKAAKRFDELLAAHPAAFADHAARFWLGPGGDPKKALALAEANLKVRATGEAYLLVIDAARAAGDTKRACAAADEAKGKKAPGLLLAARSLAYQACDRAADAEQVAKEATAAGK